MPEDCSIEVRTLIKKYKREDIEFGKPMNIISHDIHLTEEQIKDELFSLKDITCTAKQNVSGEIRYVIYFVYGKVKGRAYTLTFRNKIRVITVIPLGKRTLRKYYRTKFIKLGAVKTL